MSPRDPKRPGDADGLETDYDSPYLHDELFAGEVEPGFDARLNSLQSESPFERVVPRGRAMFDRKGDPEEPLDEDEDRLDEDDSPADAAAVLDHARPEWEEPFDEDRPGEQSSYAAQYEEVEEEHDDREDRDGTLLLDDPYQPDTAEETDEKGHFVGTAHPILEEEDGSVVIFPSGVALRVLTGLPEGRDEDHWDPSASDNPLLDTGAAHKDKLLSASFTVRELTTSGGVSADIARIDPRFVECLQRLQDHVGKTVTIKSGYRSWKRNKQVYANRKNKDGTPKRPTRSQHCGGRAADIAIHGMNGLEIARAAIDVCGPDIGIGLARRFAHIDRRGFASVWDYGGAPASWEAEIRRYQREKGGKPQPSDGKSAPTPPGRRPLRPPVLTATPFTAATPAPADLVRFAQRVLNATEGERLNVDGDLGPLTRAALGRFRNRHSLGAGAVLDAKCELALAQRALEEVTQQSLFAQLGVRDAATEQALAEFKSERGLGMAPTLDLRTIRALTDALERRSSVSSTPNLSARPSKGIPLLTGSRRPPEFTLTQRGAGGLARYGGDRVDKKVSELVRRHRLSITDQDIDTFQRVANVETKGHIQGINTWDSGVVSIGFMQWTLQHGKLQEWIERAEQAFRRYGIELDRGRKYVWTAKNGPNEQVAIKGASDKDDLRWDGWAERFFRAGLDDEAIVVEAGLAKEHLQRHLKGLQNHLKDQALYQKFVIHYQASLQLRGVFQAAYNNRPDAAKAGTKRALMSAAAAGTEEFLTDFQDAILEAFAARDQDGSRVVSETRTGSRVT